jgi:hypothetical protein
MWGRDPESLANKVTDDMKRRPWPGGLIERADLNLDPEMLARAINVDLAHWPGNCHGIATLIREADLVPGKAEYGWYFGPVNEGSHFYGGSYPYRHGWIKLHDGRIYDPTRWVFENVDPYIYVAEPNPA